jgi:hypothetical protein
MPDRDFRRILRKYFPHHLKTEVLACPSCGKEDQLWTIVASAQSSGVGCRRCHLKVTRYHPTHWPKSMPKNIPSKDWSDWLYMYSFFIALKTWNRLLRR